jgi:hypothetical protein
MFVTRPWFLACCPLTKQITRVERELKICKMSGLFGAHVSNVRLLESWTVELCNVAPWLYKVGRIQSKPHREGDHATDPVDHHHVKSC